MPTYTIQSPDGRKITIQANDEQTAIRGAQEWSRSNSPQGKADRDAATVVGALQGRLPGGINLPAPLRRFNEDTLARARGAGLGWLDEAAGSLYGAGIDVSNALAKAIGRPGHGYTGKEGSAAVRNALNNVADRQRKERPISTFANEIAGGSWLPAAKGTSVMKAGAYGAGVGAVSGAGEGNGVTDRLKRSAVGAATGFGIGAAGQKVSNALAASANAAKAAPLSPARQLAAEGIKLTPGQMMGGMAKRIEDAATSIPIAGDAIRNRRIEGIESFNTAAINRVLAPIGERLPEGANVGREGVDMASKAVSNAYMRALSPVNLAPDADFVVKAGQIKSTANLTPDLMQEYDSVLQNTIAPVLGKQITGQQWKTIDADLGAAQRAAQNAAGQKPSSAYLANAIGGLKDEWRGLLARTSPEASQAVGAADQANANLVRIRQAAQMNGAEGGVFTPAQLSNAVRASDSSAGNRQFATGNALMQDLTDRARDVLPSKVPDSGTALRSTVNALGLTGGGVVLGLNPTAALTAGGSMIAGATAYSRPVQNLINAAYRASSPGAKRAAVAQLEALAARNPGLQQEVDRAISELVLGRADTPRSQAQPSR